MTKGSPKAWQEEERIEPNGRNGNYPEPWVEQDGRTVN